MLSTVSAGPMEVPLASLTPMETAGRMRSVSTTKDYISFKGRPWKVPGAFRGERVAVRPLALDGQYGIFFGAHQIGSIDLTSPEGVGHVSEHLSVMCPG